MPIEEVCRLYDLSADEIGAWERDLDRHGLPGLRATPSPDLPGHRQNQLRRITASAPTESLCERKAISASGVAAGAEQRCRRGARASRPSMA